MVWGRACVCGGGGGGFKDVHVSACKLVKHFLVWFWLMLLYACCQYLELIKTNVNRPAQCLSILWAVGQCGIVDLRSGLRGKLPNFWSPSVHSTDYWLPSLLSCRLMELCPFCRLMELCPFCRLMELCPFCGLFDPCPFCGLFDPCLFCWLLELCPFVGYGSYAHFVGCWNPFHSVGCYFIAHLNYDLC